MFLLATDLRPHDAAWSGALAQADQVRADCSRILGFEPEVRQAALPALREAIDEMAASGCEELFVLPATLEFNLWQRETLGQLLAEARRRHPGVAFHHDDPDVADSLVVDALAAQAARAIAGDPRRTGLLLAPSGCGDPSSRAQSYRLMRLLWEQLGVAQSDVAFIRHSQPFLAHAIERHDGDSLDWVVLSQSQWETEHVAYARVMLQNSGRDWRFADPPGLDPRLTAWLVRRAVRIWQDKRTRDAARAPSPKKVEIARSIVTRGAGVIARVPDQEAMREVLSRILPEETPERILVKVTWHGYATGTYTDPGALDLLLGALPARAVILEGHTSSRNLGGADFDWENDSRAHRAWIRQQDAEYLRRTGLSDVLAKHRAEYVNVTECFWDEECAPREQIEGFLQQRGLVLHHDELAAFVPKTLMEVRGCPMISFAKFKGPTRLAISNLFGLIPHPLRSAWHGPNITWFARVCCDLAKLYGALFDLTGMVEGLYSAVRWNRRGLYRSRWGNYDLIGNGGYVTASRGLVSADVLASRLQGQDVSRSAFFDVVRAELGWDSEAAEQSVPEDVRAIFT